MKEKSVKRILVLVFGATTGVTLDEFRVGEGFRYVWKRDIPWQMDGQIYKWPMNWLRDILAEVKQMATPGTIIAPAMWGADVVHMAGKIVLGDVLHYRSVPPEFSNKLIEESGIPKHEWARLMGHVHPEFFQMIFAHVFWQRYTHETDYVKAGDLKAIPLADWITFELTGVKGHDRVLLHNQGAAAATSKLVNHWFCDDRATVFAPVWKLFGYDELIPLKNNIYVMPCTHDSPLARLILESTGLPWGLWTGSWYGVWRKIGIEEKVVPGQKTYEAGIVFEAMPGGGVAAISNIGMHGPLYKALKNLEALDYGTASQMALGYLNRVDGYDVACCIELIHKNPVDFAKKMLIISRGDMGLALATLISAIADCSIKGLISAATALGVKGENKTAVVGGFAENRAFLEALRTRSSMDPVVPRFAGMATQAGAAAWALHLSGAAKNVKEALQMLPNVVLPE